LKIVAYQPLILSKQKQLIDYTYQSSNNKAYSLCAITSPLFLNPVWSFLYKSYGENIYGYLPAWAGQKQVLHKNFLPDDRSREKLRYLILEPEGGIPETAKQTAVFLEDHVSKLIEEKKFGQIVVQKRILNDQTDWTDSQKLSSQEKGVVQQISSVDPRYSCYIDY
jgi:hypothetical protein